jgi:phage N-6-adenine-methyltransferase
MDYANETNFVVPDCAIASPISPSTQTCEDCTLNPEQSICSVPAHPVNRSHSKEDVWEVMTSETASEQSCKLLEEANPSSFASKTCLDCYQPPLFPEPNPAHISNRCSASFTPVGTMHSGLLSEQPNLKLSGEEPACYLLPRPGALSKSSASSRPPGNTKSEAKAKKLGIIQKNEVFNPEWLEQEFGLPIGWTDPQECRAATELIALVERPLEIFSTPESLRSPLEESCTSTPYVAESDGEYSVSREEKNSNGSSQPQKSKSSDCWYTPLYIIELVLRVLGAIELDPCADDGKHIPALKHFAAADDGLSREWSGRVFMNPPYSCPGKWMKKLQVEYESGRVREAIALVPAATDTKWLSPVLKSQVACFWAGRIKFLDVNYQPRLSARQAHCLVYWGDNWQRFKEVFDEYGVVQIPLALISNELLGDKKNNPSNFISPSKRQQGSGNGSIHWRTIIKNGKDYPQAYYHWIEVGKKRTKYIPQHLLGAIQQASLEKRPVIEILELLGVGISSQKLLGDKNLDKPKTIETSTFGDNPSNNPSNYISPSKNRRDRGEGSGTIHWRTITKNGKDYPQAYYHYEFWNGGDRLTKSSRYIPKRLLPQVQKLDADKAPVREILQVLGGLAALPGV